MRPVTRTRGAVALFLVVSLLHLSSITASGGDLKNLARPSLKPVLPDYLTQTGRLPLAAQPLGVAATIGTVVWTNLQQSTPSWICRTGDNSSVTLDLKTAGKVSILERSRVNLQLPEGDPVLTLLGGSLHLSGSEGSRVRIQTYDGIYLLESTRPYQTRVSWRGGQLAMSGDSIRKLENEMASATDLGLEIRAENPSLKLSSGKPHPIGAVVTDATGQPLAEVPIRFSSNSQNDTRFRVSFSGSPSATVLTDGNGVAASKVTVIGHQGPGAIFAAIPGTTATAALPADVNPTSKGGKVAAWLVVAGIVAVSLFLILDRLDEDDPVLEPGAPGRATPTPF
jgi:hypothetical protein